MELENDKSRLEEKLKKAEFELTRYEDKVSQQANKIKELEEELKAERAARAKSENARTDLKTKPDLEEHSIPHEVNLSSLLQKHTDCFAEISEQIENLQRVKSKFESEMKMEIDDLMSTVEALAKSKGTGIQIDQYIDQ